LKVAKVEKWTSSKIVLLVLKPKWYKHGFNNLEESDNFEGANNHGVVDHAWKLDGLKW
jgi:hypothetical protein